MTSNKHTQELTDEQIANAKDAAISAWNSISDSGNSWGHLGGDEQDLLFARAILAASQAAPAWDADATKRLRSIVDLLGLQWCVPDGDLTGHEFAVLGFVRREIERLKAAGSAPVAAAVAQGDVLSRGAGGVFEWLNDDMKAMKSTLFNECRSQMGTNTVGQDQALRRTLLHFAEALGASTSQSLPAMPSAYHSYQTSADSEFAAAFAPLYTAEQVQDYARAALAQCAGSVEPAAVGQEPVAYMRFRAAQQWSGMGGHDIEHCEWLEACHAHEIGDDKQPAFPVYAAPVAIAPEVERDAALVGLLREAVGLIDGVPSAYGVDLAARINAVVAMSSPAHTDKGEGK